MHPEDSNSPLFARTRRKDKAVEDPQWIREMLISGSYGVLATCQADQPYARPTLFVYDQEAGVIYLHGARHGRTPDAIQSNPRVCFCVSEMGRLLPANTALEFGVEYASVVIFGKASLVEEEEQARRALQMLLDKYFPHMRPGEHYRPIVPEELERTAVYRIEIEEWSAKEAQAPAGFPGAFLYSP
jgi:nitroimidazol reductase NimA-like FMN-containing flavoprotein (pyridoxamine 5'-phosphate oxidase superfamily)